MSQTFPIPSFLAQPAVRNTLHPFLVSESDAAKLLALDRARFKALIADREVTIVDVAGERRVVVSSILDYVARLAATSPKNAEPRPVSAGRGLNSTAGGTAGNEVCDGTTTSSFYTQSSVP